MSKEFLRPQRVEARLLWGPDNHCRLSSARVDRVCSVGLSCLDLDYCVRKWKNWAEGPSTVHNIHKPRTRSATTFAAQSIVECLFWYCLICILFAKRTRSQSFWSSQSILKIVVFRLCPRVRLRREDVLRLWPFSPANMGVRRKTEFFGRDNLELI